MIKLIITATLLFLCGQSIAKENLWSFTTAPERCDFIISNQNEHTRSDFKGKFNNCESVLDIVHHEVTNTIALIDAQEERGGYLYVVRAFNNTLKSLYLTYMGGDEEVIEYQIRGNVLKLSTSVEVIEISIENDGSIKLLSRRQTN